MMNADGSANRKSEIGIRQSEPNPQSPCPISSRRLLANRANALKSTGPKTPEGKSRASRNSHKHGLYNRCYPAGLDGPDELTEFDRLRTELHEDLKPQSQRESLLVDQIALCFWQLDRALRFETSATEKARASYERDRQAQNPTSASTGPPVLPDATDLELLVHFEGSIDTRLHRALNDLLRCRTKSRSSGIRGARCMDDLWRHDSNADLVALAAEATSEGSADPSPTPSPPADPPSGEPKQVPAQPTPHRFHAFHQLSLTRSIATATCFWEERTHCACSTPPPLTPAARSATTPFRPFGSPLRPGAPPPAPVLDCGGHDAAFNSMRSLSIKPLVRGSSVSLRIESARMPRLRP